MGNDIVQLITDANKGRDADALQIKYKAMAESAFRFFRGSCQLFYKELAEQYPFPASPKIWACGDLHIENFGSYRGSNRLVYFDMNDYDEAVMAPAFWEICRLAVSVQVAANEAGFSKKEKISLLKTLLQSYTRTLVKGRSIVIEYGAARGIIKKLISKVADRKEMELVNKRTDEDHPDKLAINKKLLKLPGKEVIINSFNRWLEENGYDKVKAIDAGFRIAGTGSIGVKRYILLLSHTGNENKKSLIDVKQAMPAAASTYVNIPQPAWKTEAERVITVQEMMAHVSPAFLSSFQYNENWFVIKELQPTDDKVDLFQTISDANHMENYIADLGILTASAQLRASGRKGSANADELCAFAADDRWESVVIDWCEGYAEQIEKEYIVYKNAWKSGSFSI